MRRETATGNAPRGCPTPANTTYEELIYGKSHEALLAKHPSAHLGQLAIPGSHDAGTSQSDNHYIADQYNVTEDWSVINQLLPRVRYLDLRCTRAGNGAGSEDGGIWTHHAGYKGEKLERALNGIKLFLKAYPGEFVLVHLSHEQNIACSEVETEMARVFGYLKYAQYPLFKAWLQTPGSDKAGVLSNDWFGSAAEVAAGVRLVIDKNRNRIT